MKTLISNYHGNLCLLAFCTLATLACTHQNETAQPGESSAIFNMSALEGHGDAAVSLPPDFFIGGQHYTWDSTEVEFNVQRSSGTVLSGMAVHRTEGKPRMTIVIASDTTCTCTVESGVARFECNDSTRVWIDLATMKTLKQ